MHERSLFTVPSKPRSRTSDVLTDVIAYLDEPIVTLRTLTNRLGDRVFGMLLVVISIVTIIPLLSSVAGLIIVLLGIQMMLGRTQAWLPKQILDKPLPNQKLKTAILAVLPKIKTIERYLHPRLQFTEAYIVDRFNGMIIMLLGIVIILPIPFTNILPALITFVMGMGLLERDGLVQLSAFILGLVLLFLGYCYLFV